MQYICAVINNDTTMMKEGEKAKVSPKITGQPDWVAARSGERSQPIGPGVGCHRGGAVAGQSALRGAASGAALLRGSTLDAI